MLTDEGGQFDYEHDDRVFDAKTKLLFFGFAVVFAYVLFRDVAAREENRPPGTRVPDDPEASEWTAPLLFVFFALVSAAIFVLLKTHFIP